jgi:hypothetical protein
MNDIGKAPERQIAGGHMMALSELAFIGIKSLLTPSPITQDFIDMRVRTSIE